MRKILLTLSLLLITIMSQAQTIVAAPQSGHEK